MHLPEIGGPKTNSSEKPEGLSLPDLWCPNAQLAHKALLLYAASLQGFSPFAGWSYRFRISPSLDALALLAFTLLGVLPFPLP